MTSSNSIAGGLATAFLSGPWHLQPMVERANMVLGPQPRRRWVRPLARRVLAAFGKHPRHAALAHFIKADSGFQRALTQCDPDDVPTVSTLRLPPPVMTPSPGIPDSWKIPVLTTRGSLAEWLGLRPGELDWFADCRGLSRHPRPERLCHYRYRWIAKSSGK